MLHPLQLFKTLSDETRLSIVMLLREAGELCVCDPAPQPRSHSRKSRAIWPYFANPGWLSTVVREVGLLPFVSEHACVGSYRHR